MTVTVAQRFTRTTPCPICAGFDGARRGHGQRCFGFLSSDGTYAHCTREEHAGTLPIEGDAATYAHRLSGPCRCGTAHNPPAPAVSNVQAGPTTPQHIVATYVYETHEGELIEVVRYGPEKTFRQRRRHPTRPGEYVWHVRARCDRADCACQHLELPELTPRLYRVDRLLGTSSEGSVVIVEGERDVETAEGIGLTATCNLGGAGKWKPAYSGELVGASVVIVADHDPAGRRHAQEIARSLHATARSLRVLELPGAGVKDLTDWVATAGTKVDFNRIAAGTPEWSAEGRPEEALSADSGEPSQVSAVMVSWREIEALTAADPPDQLVGEILAAGDTALIHGFTGAHKTNTALEMALSIDRGVPFLGHFPTRQAHVGIFDEESEIRRLGGRLALLARAHDIGPGDDCLPVFAVGGGLRIDTDEGIERAFQMVGANHLDVIFIDTLIRVHRLDENVAGDMAQLFTRLRGLKRRVRDELGRTLTIVLVHHAPKPRMFGNAAETMARGSGDILGQADVGLYLTKTGSGQVLVTFSKNRWGPEGTKFLVNVEGGKDRLRLVYAGEAADALGKAEQAHTYVIDALGAAPDCELTRKELHEGATAAKVSKRTLDDALKAMKVADEVTTRKDGREAVYRLTETGMTQ